MALSSIAAAIRMHGLPGDRYPWPHRHATRAAAVSNGKRSPAYEDAHQAAVTWQILDEQMPRTPDPWDQQVTKRQWDNDAEILEV